MSHEPIVHSVFEPKTCTWQYVVADPQTSAAVLIDTVLDFDPATGTISHGTADSLLSLAQGKGYHIEKILETHVHADHLTAAKYIQHKLEATQGSRPDICIGKRITEVQQRFAQRYGIPPEEYEGAFDKLFDDNEVFMTGSLEVKVLHLPGHTPDHVGYVVGANVFCGDSLFNSDVGSARCDFPGGNSHQLYESVQKLLSLPDDFKIWTGHDYPPGGDSRTEPKPYQTVAEQAEANKHVKKGVPESDFVQWRNGRDASLAEPKLLHQSLQFNIRAGRLPTPSVSGDRLVHVPLRIAGETW
ncbi:hypothetical protein DL546_009261 [Coniochaeta pulveracea]|uniref:Metallo-beta-lactamase domain-containing protein n=1 Tax=Coniochaeta pulveracea TaxID=177199 RepID=A0A420YM03_9PEZI|nr:hypothetical protein DL546_009261 [Coniochaeta pulveracea]